MRKAIFETDSLAVALSEEGARISLLGTGSAEVLIPASEIAELTRLLMLVPSFVAKAPARLTAPSDLTTAEKEAKRILADINARQMGDTAPSEYQPPEDDYATI